MSFFNYFTDSERGAAKRATDLKNRAFGWIGPLLARLHVPPDAISYTGLALLIGVVIWFISHPYRAVGLLVLYVIIDGMDGAYARYLERSTQSGAFTDMVCDQLGMVVITLGFIQHRLVDGQVGAYYIMIYLIMIVFSVIQNSQGIPMQYEFRSKYVLYGIYALWAFTRINLAPVLLPLFCLIMTFSVVQSYLRLKRGFYWKFDMPKILRQEQEIRSHGGHPPRLWPILNFVVPALVVTAILILGAYTQILGMTERANVRPDWKKSPRLPLLDEDERPRAVASFKDGWLVTAYLPETGFSRVYHLDRNFSLIGSFRVPFALHPKHGLCTDDDNHLYVADRLSRSVFDIDVSQSMGRGIAALDRSFDTTLRAPVACVLIEHQGARRMLVAEYMSLYKTILVDYEKAFRQGTAEDAMVGWYRNMGFSRGLASDGTRLYEINGSLWHDLIYVLDPETSLSEKYLRAGMIEKIGASRWHCRDIAVNGKTLALVDGKSPYLFLASLSLQ